MRAPQLATARSAAPLLAVVLACALSGCGAPSDEADPDTAPTSTAARTTPAPPTATGADGSPEATTAAPETTTPAAPTTGDPVAETTTAAAEAPRETEPSTSATHTSPEATTTASSDDVIVVSDLAVFTTPAQAAYCILSAPTTDLAASISCEVAQSSVPADDPLMGVCSAEGIGWFFNFFADVGHAGFFCNHVDGITRGGGNPHYWQDDPWIDPDNVVTLDSGARVAVLDYGRVMRAGDLECSVQPDGLTCTASGSGHGFTVNSASYTTW